jgi:hypothetical protein
MCAVVSLAPKLPQQRNVTPDYAAPPIAVLTLIELVMRGNLHRIVETLLDQTVSFQAREESKTYSERFQRFFTAFRMTG